jgi:hypothetical protein
MMTSNHDEACYLFGEVVDRMFDPLINLTNTFCYVSRAIDIAGVQLATEKADRYLSLATNPHFANIFGHTYKEISTGAYRSRVAGIITSELELGKRRSAASILVFAHSIFESAVQDCLMIAYHASPEDWMSEIQEKKLPVKQIISSNTASICTDLILDLIRGLDHQSVLKRLDVFHRITKPPAGHIQPVGYEYDRTRIETIDEARHRVAHDNPTSYDPELLDKDVDYFRMTILYLLGILIAKYNIRNITRPKNGQQGGRLAR